jgi:hypothetical protein
MARIASGLARGGLLLAALAPTLSCSAATPVADQAPMMLGISTHFDQRWPLARLDQVKEIGAHTIRDDLPWGKGEPSRGHYVFDEGDSRYIKAACAKGLDVLLMVDPRNVNYDDQQTAHSPEAQKAFAVYLNKLIDFYGAHCVTAIEVGNEINADGLHLPKDIDGVQTYASLLATIHQVVKPVHPDVRILGGSTNVIGTGFLDALFKAGALPNMDGVVVHPYRDHPEGVEIELARVDAAMKRAGGHKPIWATEFGNQVDDPKAAATLLLRMFALMSAAGVDRAYWYVLLDEPIYRNMGMYDDGLRIKPAGEAGRVVTRLLSAQRGVRVDVGDRDAYVFRFGPKATVMWGAPRDIHFTGSPQFLDAEGKPLASFGQLSADPVIVTGDFQFTLGPRQVLADSLYQFGGAPWSYFARRNGGSMEPLTMIDWTWTSYYGGTSLRPLELKADTAIAAGDGNNPLSPTLRYTAPAAEDATVSACLGKSNKGAGMRIGVFHNGQPIHNSVLVDHETIDGPAVHLTKGDTLDFAFAPNGNQGNDALAYRIRLLPPGSKAAAICD